MILRIVEFHGAHLLRMILFVFSLYLQSIVYLQFMFLNLGSKYVPQVCCVTALGHLFVHMWMPVGIKTSYTHWRETVHSRMKFVFS